MYIYMEEETNSVSQYLQTAHSTRECLKFILSSK